MCCCTVNRQNPALLQRSQACSRPPLSTPCKSLPVCCSPMSNADVHVLAAASGCVSGHRQGGSVHVRPSHQVGLGKHNAARYGYCQLVRSSRQENQQAASVGALQRSQDVAMVCNIYHACLHHRIPTSAIALFCNTTGCQVSIPQVSPATAAISAGGQWVVHGV